MSKAYIWKKQYGILQRNGSQGRQGSVQGHRSVVLEAREGGGKVTSRPCLRNRVRQSNKTRNNVKLRSLDLVGGLREVVLIYLIRLSEP